MSLGRRMFISFGLGAVLTLGVFGLRTLSAQQAPATAAPAAPETAAAGELDTVELDGDARERMVVGWLRHAKR